MFKLRTRVIVLILSAVTFGVIVYVTFGKNIDNLKGYFTSYNWDFFKDEHSLYFFKKYVVREIVGLLINLVAIVLLVCFNIRTWKKLGAAMFYRLSRKIIILMFSLIALGLVLYGICLDAIALKEEIDFAAKFRESQIFDPLLSKKYLIKESLGLLIKFLTIALLAIINIHIWRKSVLTKEAQEFTAKRKKERLQAKKAKLEQELSEMDKIE